MSDSEIEFLQILIHGFSDDDEQLRPTKKVQEAVDIFVAAIELLGKAVAPGRGRGALTTNQMIAKMLQAKVPSCVCAAVYATVLAVTSSAAGNGRSDHAEKQGLDPL